MTDEDNGELAFCEREHPRLVRSLTLYTGDRELAAELAQEALARACAHWVRVSAMEAPGAWLHRVALNLAHSSFARRRAEQRAHARHGGVPTTTDPSSAVDLALTLRRAVAALPRRQRTAVVLRYVADLSVADTAAVMGCAEGTVRALTHQGTTALRRSLDTDIRHEEGTPHGR